MRSKSNWRKIVFSALILWTFLLNSIPVKAQRDDIVGSDDISGGSSVFVFRQSRKAQQVKFAARANVRRTPSQRAESRNSFLAQVAKTKSKTASGKDNSQTVLASNQTGKGGKGGIVTPPIKTGSKTQASEAIAAVGANELQAKNFDKAVEAFQSAVRLSPANQNAKLGLSEALTGKADALLDKDDAAGAISLYNEAIKLNDRNAAAFAGLGSAYEASDNTDSALLNYNKALTVNSGLTELYAPIGAIYYRKSDFVKADEMLTKAAAARSDDEQTQYLLGLIRSKQNRSDEAVAALKRSLAVKDSAEAHYYLGELYDQSNREAEAINEYKNATRINPRYFEAWFDLGAAYYNRARYDEAIEAYMQAIGIKNNSADTYENLGDVYRQQKNYANAEGRYNQAIDLVEKSDKKAIEPKAVADLYSKTGFVQGRLRKWEGAIVNLQKAINISQDAVDNTNLGWAYYNLAQYNKAVNPKADVTNTLTQGKMALQKAVAMNGGNAGTYMNLGLTQNDLGEHREAVESFKKCLQLKNNWVPALNELGYAYRYLNQLDDAARNFRLATELDKNYYPAFYNLGETEFRRGNIKAAKEAAKDLRRLNPAYAARLEVIISGAVLTNPAQKLENKIKNKIPKLPY